MDYDKLFWDASLEDMKKGYTKSKNDDIFVCLSCYETFEQGIIYNSNGLLMTADKAVKNHIKEKHTSVFDTLIEMDKKYTGLTDHQKELLKMFYNGISDKEIVKESKGSSSTIRNQRFTLREKAKQAKIFLAIMELLEERKNERSEDELIPIHKTATTIDARYAITESEKKEFIEKYFKDGKLTQLPKKQKRIIVILQHIATIFEANRKYTELEVNALLKEKCDDYVTIRRYLIEYGFLDRTLDCHEYWLKIS